MEVETQARPSCHLPGDAGVDPKAQPRYLFLDNDGIYGRGVREFIEEYYHVARPHQGRDGDTPIPQPQADAPITGPTKLISTPILGGLHHRYQRVAA